MMIVDEKLENYNACLNAKQEVKETYQKIEENLKPYLEFLKVMKEVVKLAKFEDKQQQDRLIHEDMEEMI